VEMKRRTFLRLALGAVALAIAGPVLQVLGRVFPSRCVEAVRGRFYPGPVRGRGEPGAWPASHAQAPGAAKWAG